MPIFWNVIKLIFWWVFWCLTGNSCRAKDPADGMSMGCHSSLPRKVFLHSVALISRIPSTCVLQMYFLLSLGDVSVALGTDGAGWLGRLEWGAVHLQSPQITASEAALIHNACLNCPPTVGAIPCGLVEIKAPVSTHELKSIHQLSPAECLRSSCDGAGEGEQAQGQVEEMGGWHDVHLYLQGITKAALK